MKLSRRSAAALVSGLAVAVTLAGCSASSSTPPSATGAVKGAIQMSYWGSSSRVAKTNNIISLFQQKYPGTTVQPQVGDFTTYFQKLNVQAASKTIPCVTTLQTRQLNDYTTNGTFIPLDDYVSSGAIDVSAIPKNVLDQGRGPDGKLYMVPFGVAWNAITINQAMAKKAGITPLPFDYTWDQFQTWLKDAKSKLPSGVAPINESGGQEPLFSAYVIGNGQKMFDSSGKIAFSQEFLEKYWNMWEDLRKQGLTNSMEDAADEPTQIEQTYVVRGKVLAEQTAGNALAAATAAAPDENLTTVPFATGSSGLGNMFFTSGFGISKNCSNVPTAAAFINFWTNDDAAASVFASDNGAVANSRQLDQQVAKPASPAVKQELQVYQYILGKKVAQPVLPAGYNATFEQSFLREYQNIAFGKETVAEGAAAFIKEADGSLG